MLATIPMHCAEMDDSLFARESAAIEALDTIERDDEMESYLEAQRAMDAIDRRRDMAISLHEFILNARYEKRVRSGEIVER